ncbi:MAG: GNAT family N-acetyltransferase [Proteobacteria bacterium]|nr:GNAT family N-acetyltransferase [Pseudomonadota bacterium]
MSDIVIRKAAEEDCALILEFIRGLADYEKALHEVKASEEDLRTALFCDHPKAFALICSLGDTPVGFALYFFNYSTWTGKFGLFLEDLYIVPESRGSGAGKALLQHLAQLALENDCSRFEWNVLDWNEPAIKFYESFGAKSQKEWLGYRLSGQDLNDFAAN